LKELTPDETYLFRIQGRVNSTKTYTFQTLNDTESVHIALFSDTQFDNLDQARIYGDTLDALYVFEEDIDFGILTGDIVEIGGNQNYWDMFYDVKSERDELMISAVPGNHDYYQSGGSLVSNQFFNTFFNNPDNGEVPYLNSSYYFTIKDTLFLMLDTVGEYQHDSSENTYGAAQITWFKSVIENNPASHIVVGMHYSPYGNHHYDTSRHILNVWGEVFDEMQVDIVISGHDHVYTRTHPMYNQTVATGDNGTVYLSLGSAGYKLKELSPDGLENYVYYQSEAESLMVLMSIDETAITFTTVNQNSEIVDTFTMTS